jgi:hypothetical protein
MGSRDRLAFEAIIQEAGLKVSEDELPSPVDRKKHCDCSLVKHQRNSRSVDTECLFGLAIPASPSPLPTNPIPPRRRPLPPDQAPEAQQDDRSSRWISAPILALFPKL